MYWFDTITVVAVVSLAFVTVRFLAPGAFCSLASVIYHIESRRAYHADPSNRKRASWYVEGTLGYLVRGDVDDTVLRRTLRIREAVGLMGSSAALSTLKKDDQMMKAVRKEYPTMMVELLSLVDTVVTKLQPNPDIPPNQASADELLKYLACITRKSEVSQMGLDEGRVTSKNVEEIFRKHVVSIEQLVEILSLVVILARLRIDAQPRI